MWNDKISFPLRILMFKLLHTNAYQAEHFQEATAPAQTSPEAWLLTVGYQMWN